MFGLYFGMIILGLTLGFVVTAWIVFYSVKNKATIIEVQLLGDKLDESTTLLFAVRRNIKDDLTYRCPYTILEGLSAFVKKKHWQKNHERRIIGKPVRASCVKIDDKIISALHYTATKIEFVNDCIDSMIIHAYDDPKLGLATIGAANNIKKESKDKKAEEVTQYYLQFVKGSIADLNKQLSDELEKRTYLFSQLLPLAKIVAMDAMRVDIVQICAGAGLPELDKIVSKMIDDPKPTSEGQKDFDKLIEEAKKTIVTGKYPKERQEN